MIDKLMSLLNTMTQNFISLPAVEKFWLLTGFIGQAAFTARFIVQWLASEKEKRSVVPVSFWFLSIIGSTIVLAYAIYRKDPVFIVAYAFNNLIYFRNLVFIYRHKTPGNENTAAPAPAGKSIAGSAPKGDCPVPPVSQIQTLPNSMPNRTSARVR